MPINNNAVIIDSNQNEVPLTTKLNSIDSNISSTIFGSQVKINTFEERTVENGECYFQLYRFPITGNGTVDIGFYPKAATNNLYLSLPSFQSIGTTIFVDLYFADIDEDGTLIPLYNCNGKNTPASKLTPKTVTKLNPTVNSTILNVANFTIYGSTLPQGGGTPGAAVIGTFIKVDTTQNFLIRFTEQDNIATTITYELKIVETDELL